MNEFFAYKDNELYCENLRASELAAQFGTPVYVYSANAFRKQFHDLSKAFAEVKPLVCYSVKANSNLAVLDLLNKEGCGFDAVSQGEIMRCLKVGVDPHKIVFAGVGKTAEEVAFAINAGILMFNVESENELEMIGSVARGLGKPAGIALRLNPDVDPKTHSYITTGKRENKFGIDLVRAESALDVIEKNDFLKLMGMHMHIGSQITIDSPHAEAVMKITPFLAEVKKRGFPLEFINIGGGFGITYEDNEGLPISAFAEQIVPAVKATGLRMLTEPGRFIAGNSGILLTRVIYNKLSGDKIFSICDGAMNDLLRPSIYDAYHRVWPVNEAFRKMEKGEGVTVDVVGPICESGDFFAKNRQMPEVKEGELLAVFSCGAYGFAMASNYNTRPRCPEILVDGDSARVVRERESYDDLLKHELCGVE